MNDQRGNANASKHRADIDTGIHLGECNGSTGACRETLKASPPCRKAAILRLVRRKQWRASAGSPRAFNPFYRFLECGTIHDPSMEVGVGPIENKRACALGVCSRK